MEIKIHKYQCKYCDTIFTFTDEDVVTASEGKISTVTYVRCPACHLKNRFWDNKIPEDNVIYK